MKKVTPITQYYDQIDEYIENEKIKRVGEVKKRQCLRCSQYFLSEHKLNRLCKRCTDSREYFFHFNTSAEK
jgi:ribosomal protein S27AE